VDDWCAVIQWKRSFSACVGHTRQFGNVRSGSKADISHSITSSARARSVGGIQAKAHSRFHGDDEIELSRLENRQINGLSPFTRNGRGRQRISFKSKWTSPCPKIRWTTLTHRATIIDRQNAANRL
jgi:hypothetical protein